MAAFVQQMPGSVTSSATLVITLDAASTAGNCLVATWLNDSANILGITGGGTWALAKLTQAQHYFSGIWICPNATATSTITITFASTAGVVIAANVSEYSGLDASPLDTTNNNYDVVANGAVTTGSVTPTTAANLVIAMAAVATGYAAGPTGGFTGLTTVDPSTPALLSAYLVQSAATAANCGWTAAGTAWDAAIVALKGAAATPPTWTTPADTVNMPTTPDLKFTSPTSAAKQHFQLQLDTVATFDSGNLQTYDSSTVQTNWTYWDGAAWQAMPSDGLPIAKSGNEIDYTITSALSASTWYRRVRAGTWS